MTTWYVSRDDQRRTALRIEHRMTLRELASVLAYLQEAFGDDPDSLTGAQVRERVRNALYAHGRDCATEIDPDERHERAARRGFAA